MAFDPHGHTHTPGHPPLAAARVIVNQPRRVASTRAADKSAPEKGKFACQESPISGKGPLWAAGPPKPLAEGTFYFERRPYLSPLVDFRSIDKLGDEPFGLYRLASHRLDGEPLGLCRLAWGFALGAPFGFSRCLMNLDGFSRFRVVFVVVVVPDSTSSRTRTVRDFPNGQQQSPASTRI
uniref:p0696G06.18 protein n=1 Tax=Oryza sativa subsp. japonica TaxID=39947 RepID=Q7F436_ORYSJ|nr:P0696G06.18 [Oryza sativa Japonica Group]